MAIEKLKINYITQKCNLDQSKN